MNSEHLDAQLALAAMYGGQPVTDGKNIYYYVKQLPLPGGLWRDVVVQAKEENVPEMVVSPEDWLSRMKTNKFQFWSHPMTSGEAERALRDGDAVEDLGGIVYIAADVHLRNGSKFEGVFQKRKGCELEYAGLLDNFSCKPNCGAYKIHHSNVEED